MPQGFELNRVNLLGVGVHAINMSQALEIIDTAIQAGKRGYICVTGIHGIMEAQKDTVFRDIVNNSLLTTPDGMPTVWVGRLQGFSKMSRVFGPDLMLRVCEMSLKKGYTHFLYGGDTGVAERLKEALVQRFPGLRIVGTFSPPFRLLTGREEAELTLRLSELRPDIFWVGLSTPKQERFMAKYLQKWDTKVMLGVGAAFDIHTGRIQDAPDWVKNAGLQWLHRLRQEPARLWRRYLINNPKFIIKITLQIAGFKKYPPV
ncbi:MAG TPA: WecB/TagA/CpsF family glycosyltransferase [Terriglobales bacterium]|nr:WecB/TagA/CpsF family glycosyltransferase [Terriglobales bacterium]